MYTRRNNDEELDVFHGSSKRTNHVISTTNVLVLSCYYPTLTFSNEKMNHPCAQFVYGSGAKRSTFIDKQDAGMIISAIKRMKEDWDPEVQCTVELSKGLRLKISPKGGLWFMQSGDRWVERLGCGKDFISCLITALEAFIQGKGEEYPTLIDTKYENGVDTSRIFQLTHHGDEGYAQPLSYLRYIHSTNGEGGVLTVRYGRSQLHLGTSLTRGVNWANFVRVLCEAVQGIGDLLSGKGNDLRAYRERMYDDHPVLGNYNCYVSAVQEQRGLIITLNTDLSLTDSKVTFVVRNSCTEAPPLDIKKTNYHHLDVFLKTIDLFHSPNVVLMEKRT